MADAQRTIDLVFNGVDKTGAAVQSALRNTEGFASNIQSATAPIANATTAAVKFEAALLATGAAATAFAIKVAGDFDGAFREITTLIDEPVESLQGFRQEILDYASGSTQSLDDVTTALYTALSAGIDYTDSLEFLTTAEQLAVAGRADLASSTNILISSLNAYAASTEDAARFSDVLFETVRQGQVTLPQLVQGFSQVTQSASTLGIPIETLGAAIATLTASGVPAAQAFTQLRAVLSNLIKPSKEALDTAADLGIEFGAAAVKSRGFEGVLQDIATATGGSEEQLGKLFGSTEALGSVFTLTGVNAGKFSESLAAIEGSAGATTQAYEKMAQSFEIQNTKVANAFNTFLTSVGTPLLDEYGSLADGISRIFQAIGQSADGGNFGELVSFIEANLGRLSEVADEVAQNLPAALAGADFSGFTRGIEAITGAFDDLFDGVDITTVEGLTGAIELLGAGFLGLSEFTAGVIDSLQPLFGLLQDLADGAGGVAIQFRELGNIGGFALQLNTLAGSATVLTQALTGLVGILGAKGLAGAFGSAAAGLSSNTGLLALLGKAGLVGAAGGAGVALGTLANKATEVATGESLSSRLADWALELTGVNDNVRDALAPMDSLASSTEAAAGSAERAAESFASVEDAAAAGVGTLEPFGNAIERAAGSFDSIEEAAAAGVGTFIPYAEAATDAADATARLGADGANLTGYFSVVSSGADAAATSITSLANASDELRAEAVIAAIEGATQIDVARIEADAERVSAAFDSIGQTVVSTGDSLNDLFGLLGDNNISKFDKLGIQEQIDLGDP